MKIFYGKNINQYLEEKVKNNLKLLKKQNLKQQTQIIYFAKYFL